MKKMYKGQEIVNIAEKQLGTRGAQAKAYCGLPSNANYCDAFVSWLFNVAKVRNLFCNGVKQTYCPTTIKILYKENASIPIYLAMPGDIILFDWEPNGNPNHIGIVKNRVSDLEIDTVEGNTSGYDTTGVVAEKTRTYFATVSGKKRVVIQAVFRPEFAPDKFDADKKLKIDGQFGFNSIARMQKALKKLGYYTGKVDAILGQQTVMALQEWSGVADIDGSWGVKTSKAIQQKLGVKVDGFFGIKSTKALQRWANNHAEDTLGDKIAETAKSYVGKVKYVKGGTSLKTGIDCTGFIQAIYGLNGIKLDNKLSSWGKSIGKDLNKAKPGDILSFKDPKTGAGHHAIYIGGGKCVHASTSHKDWKKDVCVSEVNKLSKPLAGIRRRWK